MKRAAISAIFLSASLLTCARHGPPADPAVVAVYDGGQVTAGDLDAAVLALPPAERRLPAGGAVARYEEVIRELVLDRLVLADAEAAGEGDGSATALLLREGQHQELAEAFLARNLKPPAPPTDAEMRRYFDEHRDRFRRPARRLVTHLFRRLGPGASPGALLAEVAGYRQRVLNGESLGRLAAEHSDSETREDEGMLGWVEERNLAPELGRVLFSLPVGVPSEPIRTSDGVHLFLVAQAVEAKTFSFDEVRLTIARELVAQRRQAAVDDLAARFPLPPESFVPEPDELRSLMAAGDPEVVVLRVGDYEVTAAAFRHQLDEVRRVAPDRPPAAVALELLHALETRERFLASDAAQRLAAEAEVAAALARRRRHDLAQLLRRRRMMARLSDDTDRLQAFYQDHQLRFSTPLRLQLRRLSLPLSDDAPAAMARLAAAGTALAAGKADLDSVAAETGAKVEELGWLTLSELGRRVTPRAQRLAAELAVGEVSPPFRTQHTLELLAVTGRREPEPQPFAAVRDQVAAAYLGRHGQEVYRRWADETLAAAHLEIFPQRLENREIPVAEPPPAAAVPPAAGP
jgi:parvulin-like peptidyl-prolyl isomerase